MELVKTTSVWPTSRLQRQIFCGIN